MSDYVIGIDIGTGSTKALAIDFKGSVTSSSQVHYPTLNPAPGYFEQAPEIIWQAFIKCLNRIAHKHTNPAAIILSSAMHSIIAVDEKGNALHNAIIWTDRRSSKIAQRIRRSAAGEMLYEQTGTPIHAMSPMCKLVWLKENNPSLFNAATRFISIKEYIWYKLFNVFEVDHSIASATGLMDIDKFCWSDNALDTCGLDTGKLSEIVSTSWSRSEIPASIAGLLEVPQKTLFIIGASDGCFANLGSLATEPGIAALTIGTSGALRVASPKPVQNFQSMTFNYRLDEKTFICGGPTNNGGAVFKWYAENHLLHPLDHPGDYDAILGTLDQTPPGADGLIFLPYIFGERAPVWNSDASGVFFGIRSRHLQRHFTRAVVEGISMAVYDIADHMLQSGMTLKKIHVSGGFVHSSPWLQVLADIFNQKISLINTHDASAVGAAYLGLKTLGIITDYSTLKPDVIKDILPQPAYFETYRNNFEIYRHLYQHLKGFMVSQND